MWLHIASLWLHTPRRHGGTFPSTTPIDPPFTLSPCLGKWWRGGGRRARAGGGVVKKEPRFSPVFFPRKKKKKKKTVFPGAGQNRGGHLRRRPALPGQGQRGDGGRQVLQGGDRQQFGECGAEEEGEHPPAAPRRGGWLTCGGTRAKEASRSYLGPPRPGRPLPPPSLCLNARSGCLAYWGGRRRGG